MAQVMEPSNNKLGSHLYTKPLSSSFDYPHLILFPITTHSLIIIVQVPAYPQLQTKLQMWERGGELAAIT